MDLEVVARHALFFDDDAMAAFVNSGDALVEWHSLKIDRYDVRHLLSAPPPPRRRNHSYEPRISDDPAVEFLIDQERYHDLPLDTDQPELEEEERPSNSGGYRSVAFSYGSTDDSTNQKNTDVGMEASGYLPPFFIPRDIVQSLIFRCMEQGCNSCDLRLPYTGTFCPFDVMTKGCAGGIRELEISFEDCQMANIPPTEKVHQIIARTATFVSKHGDQSEIVLRVKQGDNPTFGFLMPDHHLHAYFRYLVEHPEILHIEINEKSQDGRKTAGTEHNSPNNDGGALSLLGSVYGSGEDEDDDDAVNASPSHDARNVESVENAAKDESISRKPILSKKDKVPVVKKNSSIIGSKPKSVKGIKKEDSLFSAAVEKLKNHGIGATSKQILEPIPELKRLIDKLVEFVMRNGRQFEATLLEQDSKLERFSFLLPSSQYHSYYLKALQAAQESKVNGKSFYPGLEDQSGRGISKKAFVLKENDISHSTSEFCDVPFESDKKEKFKMVIGKSKKEAHETEKESQESEFTVDAAAAAAILQAATKGFKSSGLQIIRSTVTNSHNNVVRNEDGQPAIAGAASHGAAGGDDSSDANLTEEQKLKAERLKRAKMFVAMLKSGALPSRTGTSRGSSSEPIESGKAGTLKSAGEDSRASQEREGSLAPAVVEKPAAKGNFDERQSEQRSKRKYHSRSIGSEDDEEDSRREGHSSRRYRSRSRRHGDDENENAVKEGRFYREKGKHRSHSTKENKNDEESSQENKDRKHTKSLRSSHHSQREDDVSGGICNEERDEKYNRHHSERTYRSRSHKEEEVGNAVEKDQKQCRRRRSRSHSSSEESENGEESELDTEHKHYRAKHRSHHSHGDDSEREGTYEDERDKEHQKSRSWRSYGSRSRRHEDKSETENAVEKEDMYCRRKHSSHSSSEENGGESSGDGMNHKHSKLVHLSSHSKHKDDGREDNYKEEKDHKRSRKSRRSRHSSSESPGRHSSERRNKQRSSHTSHDSRDKHRHKSAHSSKDKECSRQNKHDRSWERASSDQLEEGEIRSKVSQDESKGMTSGDGRRGASVDVVQRAPSQPSETTEVPADLRAKIRAMLMATRS